MNRGDHDRTRILIQCEMDGALSSDEQSFLEAHTKRCRECREYRHLHKELRVLGARKLQLGLNDPAHPRPPIAGIRRAVQGKRRVRRAIKVAQYAVVITFALLLASWFLPRLPVPAGPTNLPVAGPTTELPTAAANASLTSTPTLEPSPTASIRFNLGKVINWPEVRFFQRSDVDVVDAEAMHGDPQREDNLTLDELAARVDFDLVLPKNLPKGYSLERAWYEPSYDSAGVCYVGPVDQQTHSRPRLCLRERVVPFEDLVGHSATVRSMTIGGAYAEYVDGGWLSISPAGADNRMVQWDDRMVPTTAIRFTRGGIFFAVSDVALDCSNPVPICPETLTLAESLR